MAYEPHLPEITAVIQLAVAPVFMLTAVGTIISALSIRLGRAVDRRRDLEVALPRMPPEEKPSAHQELEVIARRIRFVYFSIVLGGDLGPVRQPADRRRVPRQLPPLGHLVPHRGHVRARAMLALTVSLLLFLREIFLAVSTPRHIPR